MGLDWNPMARAKPGYEAEHSRILELDLDSLEADERERTIERFHEICEAAYETLGAPRVGYDQAANQWLNEMIQESGKLKGLSEGEAEDFVRKEFEEMHGFFVLDLLPASAGLPVYVPAGNYEGVDRYTFRGKFLDVVSDLLGDELHERAWERMSPGELKEYGEALLRIGREYAREHGCAGLETERDPPEADADDAPEFRAHILFSAAHWCLFWSEKGHGLDPYF